MFEDKSRYSKLEPYIVEDSRGRQVSVVPVTSAPQGPLLGVHLRQQSQRLDHLAYKYLQDGAAFWWISEANDVMLPEALTEQSEINIPSK